MTDRDTDRQLREHANSIRGLVEVAKSTREAIALLVARVDKLEPHPAPSDLRTRVEAVVKYARMRLAHASNPDVAECANCLANVLRMLGETP